MERQETDNQPSPTPQIRVGTIAIAKRPAGVANTGERGICYELYDISGRPGYSFLFENGGYDGFSPDDVTLCLGVTNRVIPSLATYRFSNVGTLVRDFQNGRFAAAFHPAGPSGIS